MRMTGLILLITVFFSMLGCKGSKENQEAQPKFNNFNENSGVVGFVKEQKTSPEGASDEARNDKNLIHEALKSDSRSFKFASDAIKNDQEFILKEIKETSPAILDYISVRLMNDANFRGKVAETLNLQGNYDESEEYRGIAFFKLMRYPHYFKRTDTELVVMCENGERVAFRYYDDPDTEMHSVHEVIDVDMIRKCAVIQGTGYEDVDYTLINLASGSKITGMPSPPIWSPSTTRFLSCGNVNYSDGIIIIENLKNNKFIEEMNIQLSDMDYGEPKGKWIADDRIQVQITKKETVRVLNAVFKDLTWDLSYDGSETPSFVPLNTMTTFTLFPENVLEIRFQWGGRYFVNAYRSENVWNEAMAHKTESWNYIMLIARDIFNSHRTAPRPDSFKDNMRSIIDYHTAVYNRFVGMKYASAAMELHSNAASYMQEMIFLEKKLFELEASNDQDIKDITAYFHKRGIEIEHVFEKTTVDTSDMIKIYWEILRQLYSKLSVYRIDPDNAITIET